MAKQANKGTSHAIEDAEDEIRTSVDKTKENLQAGLDKGKKMVKQHPSAAVGVALGATFAAGAVAGATLLKTKKKRS